VSYGVKVCPRSSYYHCGAMNSKMSMPFGVIKTACMRMSLRFLGCDGKLQAIKSLGVLLF
jgi:hypothetical protein